MVLASCSQTNNDTKDLLPGGWKIEEMSNAVKSTESLRYPDLGNSRATTHVLVWKTEQSKDTYSGKRDSLDLLPGFHR
jgi:hypothetical protein